MYLHQRHARSFESLHIGNALQHGTDSASGHGAISEHVGSHSHTTSHASGSHSANTSSSSHGVSASEHASILTGGGIISRIGISMEGVVQVEVAKSTKTRTGKWTRSELTNGQPWTRKEESCLMSLTFLSCYKWKGVIIINNRLIEEIPNTRPSTEPRLNKGQNQKRIRTNQGPNKN